MARPESNNCVPIIHTQQSMTNVQQSKTNVCNWRGESSLSTSQLGEEAVPTLEMKYYQLPTQQHSLCWLRMENTTFDMKQEEDGCGDLLLGWKWGKDNVMHLCPWEMAIGCLHARSHGTCR